MRIVLFAALAALVLVGCSSGSQAGTATPATTEQPAELRVHGVVQLPIEYSTVVGDRCHGSARGWTATLTEGAQVIVKTDAGATVGIGSLSDGTADPTGCSFAFDTTADAGHGFYTITAGGAQPYSVSEERITSGPIGIGFRN